MRVRRTGVRRALRLAVTLSMGALLVGAGPATAGPSAGPSAAPAAPPPPATVIPDVPYGADPLQKMDIQRGPTPGAPAIVVVHGGGWDDGDKVEPQIRYAADQLSIDGFAVFTINYRLASAERTGVPISADDVGAAIRWVSERGADYNADPRDISVIGGSAGSQLGVLAAQQVNVLSPGTVRAAVGLSGPYNFVTIDFPPVGPPPADDKHKGINTYVGCVPSTCTPEQLIPPSPYYWIDAATCPAIMMVNSEDDKLIEPSQPIQMSQGLAAVGCDNTLYIPTGDLHGFGMFRKEKPTILAFLHTYPATGQISVADVDVAEGANVDVLVSLEQAATEQVSAQFSTVDGSAQAGSDFVATSGRVRFAPGATEATIPIRVLDDGRPEAVETFTVQLSDPEGGQLTRSAAQVRIVDDDTTEPVITGLSPDRLGQGVTGRTVLVNGANFTAASTATVSGAGVGITGQSVLAADQLSLTMSVPLKATIGVRTITVVTPGQPPASCACLTLTKRPQAASFSIALGAGAQDRPVTVSGTGFAPGVVATIAVNGVQASTAYVSPTVAQVTVSLPPGATPGSYNVRMTNTDGGTSICSGCYTVVAAPAPTAMTPASVRSGRTTAITLLGSNFRTGAAVTGPEGVTVTDVVVLDEGTLTAVLSVAARPPGTGLVLTVTNPVAGGYGVGSCRCLTITR